MDTILIIPKKGVLKRDSWFFLMVSCGYIIECPQGLGPGAGIA